LYIRKKNDLIGIEGESLRAPGINRLARDIAVPPGRISAIVNGKRAITADTALRLSRYFGTSPDVWMGVQADYELRIAQRTIGPEG
jgi:addiction module HigA family antidote